MSGDPGPRSGKKRHPAKRYTEEAPILAPPPHAAPVAELCAISNFSFLRGASHPDEMIIQAANLGLSAIAIADRNSFAGVVRAHAAAKTIQKVRPAFQFIPGVRLVPTRPGPTQQSAPVETGPAMVALPQSRAAYGTLTTLLSRANRRAPKGQCYFDLEHVLEAAGDIVVIVIPPDRLDTGFIETLKRLRAAYGRHCNLAARRPYGPADQRHLQALRQISNRLDVPLVATQDALYHAPHRRVLHDAVTCIRTHVTLSQAGKRLEANAERHLKSPAEMARLFEGYDDALARSIEIARSCRFNLDELKYEYPDEPAASGLPPQAELERLTWKGAQQRYPHGVPQKVETTLRHELNLIAGLDYARYFLTVFDIVRFARSQNILCQGRGSAANSSVCYVLGITAVNPMEVDLLFERFVSAARNEPPDIDVDFEHERREEVIQYIYEKYGRHRAGIAATVITYRARSAMREIGKALGLTDDITGALSKMMGHWTSGKPKADLAREAGIDPDDPLIALAIDLSCEIEGFPRHLSQHVGGFVITRGPLEDVMPIHNAAMEGRTFVEWDKDDLDALGMLKIDLLALGMLSCLRKALDLIEAHHGRAFTLATIPRDDGATYAMIQKADTLGTFQIESRAQMSMLPRLKPANFYDLVIEVAIVRPGPIQGDMVHPYLRRRDGLEQVSYPSKELEGVLAKTLGVPLFQEQAMKIAIVAAGFTAEEADQLRRAMATFRRNGTIGNFEQRLIEGMVNNGYAREFAERCFHQIEGFGDYGFPESHAASFALLAYASAYIKCHYPAAFACALLNSQPMGFYAPAQIVRDAREHGVEVCAPDINLSGWDNHLEDTPSGPALRLGFRQIKGMTEDAAQALTAARGEGYDSVRAVWLKSRIEPSALETLAQADAFRSIGLDRRDALWAVMAIKDSPLPLLAAADEAAREAEADLPAMPLGAHVVYDYLSVRLSLKAHLVSFVRPRLEARKVVPNSRLSRLKSGTRVAIAGLVLIRQRPGTAKGVIFMTLEDESGVANVIVWPKTFERYRKLVLTTRLVEIRGVVQNENGVVHLVADRLEDLTGWMADISEADGAVIGKIAASPANAARHPRDQGDFSRIIPKSRDFH